MLVILMIILVVISMSFAIFVQNYDQSNIGNILDKSIGYFGALGLPTVLFYWEWKRNRGEKHHKEKKRQAKIDRLVAKIQEQLPKCLEQIKTRLNHWNKIIQYQHANEIVAEELAKNFNYDERKLIYDYLESNEIIYLDSTQNIGFPNRKPPEFQDTIKNLNSSKYREKLLEFFDYIE